MGGATREFYRGVLTEALGILDASGAHHLVIGGLATRALLSERLDEAEDVDVLIRSVNAEPLLGRFSRDGYATYRRDGRWIYKVARPDVTIDLIFRAGERIELDDEHLARSSIVDLDDISLPVPAAEDLAVMKAVFDGEDRQGRWYGAIRLLKHFPIDWDYLAARGEMYAPRRVLSLLLYAADEGIPAPDRTFARLTAASTS